MPSGAIEQHVQAGATRHPFVNVFLRHELARIQFGPEIS